MVRIPFTRHSIPPKAPLPAQVVRLADFHDDAGCTPRQLVEARLPLAVLGVQVQRAGRRQIVFRTAERDEGPDRFVQVLRQILLDRKSDLLIGARDRGPAGTEPEDAGRCETVFQYRRCCAFAHCGI
jgi:hypothetical protein